MRELFAQVVRAAPLDEPGDVGRQRIRVGANEQMDMIGLDCQPNDLPVVFSCYLRNDLLQAILHQLDKHLAAPLWAPDDVIHDKVYAMVLVLIVQVALISFFNNVCKSERPFSPRLKTGGFLSHFFCKEWQLLVPVLREDRCWLKGPGVAITQVVAPAKAEHVESHKCAGSRFSP